MTGLEIENLAAAIVIAAAAAQHGTAGEPADEHQFVRCGNVEMLTVGFFYRQLEKFRQTLRNGMTGHDSKDPFSVVSHPPLGTAPGTHRSAERLGIMAGMQHDEPHAVPNATGNALHQLVLYLSVRRMPPPDQHVGAVQNVLGQALLRIVQRGQTGREARALANRVGNNLVQSFGIDLPCPFIGLLVTEFISDRDLNAHVLLLFLVLFVHFINDPVKKISFIANLNTVDPNRRIVHIEVDMLFGMNDFPAICVVAQCNVDTANMMAAVYGPAILVVFNRCSCNKTDFITPTRLRLDLFHQRVHALLLDLWRFVLHQLALLEVQPHRLHIDLTVSRNVGTDGKAALAICPLACTVDHRNAVYASDRRHNGNLGVKRDNTDDRIHAIRRRHITDQFCTAFGRDAQFVGML